MRRHTPRRTAPGVKDGQVQRKNRHGRTPSYWTQHQTVPVFDKERPGPGHRHLLTTRDLDRFASLMSWWDEVAVGLDAVLLARAETSSDAWYDLGVVGLCAWPREIQCTWTQGYVQEHRDLLAAMNVPLRPQGVDVLVDFSEDTAKAFQLCHLLLHELGHHADRMATHRQADSSPRGEDYAEQWARDRFEEAWARWARAERL